MRSPRRLTTNAQRTLVLGASALVVCCIVVGVFLYARSRSPSADCITPVPSTSLLKGGCIVFDGSGPLPGGLPIVSPQGALTLAWTYALPSSTPNGAPCTFQILVTSTSGDHHEITPVVESAQSGSGQRTLDLRGSYVVDPTVACNNGSTGRWHLTVAT